MNKQELALLYFPDAVPETAVRHLMRWVAGCSPLSEALSRTGYQSRNRSLTWRQVLLIRSFLGEPAEQKEPSHPLEQSYGLHPSFPLDGHKQT